MSKGGDTQKGPTYNYESLLDEHFQNLVQALLVKSFPDLKCFPVGMPDGGRDATSSLETEDPNSLVFQVKFSRNPSAIDDVFKWITKAVDGEASKVEKLKSGGLRKYIFVTNVSGTSHLELGSIDRVNAYARKKLDIDFEFFWREDLDRRLDGEFDIKLRFPHLLNGPDLLRLIWESPRGTDSLKRSRRSIEAYLKDQFRTDETLRFKQVDMITTKLFDLFIDVPIRPLPGPVRFARGGREFIRLFNRKLRDRGNSTLRRYYLQQSRHEGPSVGAADLFSDAAHMESVNRIVVEGAPGQGKSTFSQYLAQIQRARYLGRESLLEKLPDRHTSGPAYLPFKIELRDLALWLNGIDPWDKVANKAHNQAPTLEAALAAHISRYSGGSPFSVSDLQELIEAVPTLLILDALDEVADLDDRANVVNEVETAVSRLEGAPGTFVTIVTSRPTALSNAPAFSRRSFVHYSLSALDEELAFQYARKWSTARAVRERDYLEVDRILRAKLRSPHMAELAKNTMQLTILLSLILTRGSSLPDKRTELYTAYLEQFLSRESDKDQNVRDNRELILDIHGYLGYYLHARAEGKRDSGRISHDELRQLLVDYLKQEQQNVELVDGLFMAVVERVVALISRVEGTFEFEVQPLREYFAGRYLYQTASYSPPGRERRGTKPDRFDGIAPNPYWQNVTRFFAGFFSKGELMDLAFRVCELIQEGDKAAYSYPRRLALSLLQDWVFSQSPRAARMVVESIFLGRGFRWTTSMHRRAGFEYQESVVRHTQKSTSFTLSPGGGGAEYARDILYSQLTGNLENDSTSSICSMIRACTSIDERLLFWREKMDYADTLELRRKWLRVGDYLDCNEAISSSELIERIDPNKEKLLGENLDTFLCSYQDLEALNAAEWKCCLSALMQLGSLREFRTTDSCLTDSILLVTHPHLWYLLIQHGGHGISLADDTDEGLGLRSSEVKALIREISPALHEIFEVSSLEDVRRSLRPWEMNVDLAEEYFGRTWSSIEISTIAAGIKSGTERGQGVHNLVDDPASLPRRVRYARRQAKKSLWWIKQAERIRNKDDIRLLLSALIAWATTDVLIEINDTIGSLLSEMEESDIVQLCSIADSATEYSAACKPTVLSSVQLSNLDDFTPRFIRFIFARLDPEARSHAAVNLLTTEPSNSDIARRCYPIFTAQLFANIGQVKDNLLRLSECADSELNIRTPRQDIFIRDRKSRRDVPIKDILEFPGALPTSILGVAFTLAEQDRPKSTSVDRIAKAQGWFEVE